MYAVAKLDKTHLHWSIASLPTSYDRKTGKARNVIKNVLKLQVWD